MLMLTQTHTHPFSISHRGFALSPKGYSLKIERHCLRIIFCQANGCEKIMKSFRAVKTTLTVNLIKLELHTFMVSIPHHHQKRDQHYLVPDHHDSDQFE